jgi:hypothetical protein
MLEIRRTNRNCAAKGELKVEFCRLGFSLLVDKYAAVSTWYGSVPRKRVSLIIALLWTITATSHRHRIWKFCEVTMPVSRDVCAVRFVTNNELCVLGLLCISTDTVLLVGVISAQTLYMDLFFHRDVADKVWENPLYSNLLNIRSAFLDLFHACVRTHTHTYIYTQTIHIIQRKENWEVRAAPRLCDLYPGICLTNE